MSEPRRNEVVPLRPRAVETLTIPLTAAQACRRADFELRTGMTIEQAIDDFLNDELFNVSAG